jgi:Domain of unknown function (DUF4333)
MSWFKRLGLACAGFVTIALLVAGCGETIIDTAKTEEQLQASLSKSLNEKVSSVACPSDVEVEKGATFKCSVKPQKGQEQAVTLRIRNDDADVSVIDLRPANE